MRVALGGNLDLVARSVAQKLTESLGRPMIVENRPGANTIIRVENVARSKVIQDEGITAE